MFSYLTKVLSLFNKLVKLGQENCFSGCSYIKNTFFVSIYVTYILETSGKFLKLKYCF